ncbi:MAG TPA: heavy-metal-associated domain-containing protein [Planctomycetota bacterium]|nr:heavy-metal-associated domain-containing protein [Planctomycetota bacterium]
MAWMLALVLWAQSGEETYTVTIAVKSMHCDECRDTLVARLKALPGVKSAEPNAEKLTVLVTILEKHPIRLKTIQACVPGDMKMERATVSLRGTVSAFGMTLQLKAKVSNTTYELGDKDPKKNEKQAELREALGQGKKKFRITGELVERDKREVLVIESFEAVEWKD